MLRAHNNLRRIIQCISTLNNGNFANLRVLDLACCQGSYSIELAKRGANVVGIEGREINLVRAFEDKEKYGLNNLDFFQDDVRNLSVEKYGKFDIVLCLGLFYHLDVPDSFRLIEKIFAVCEKHLILDTHFALESKRFVFDKNNIYSGIYFREFSDETPQSEKDKSAWSSLDNCLSFWFTKSSLLNLLQNKGFSTVMELHNPVNEYELVDRLFFIASKGQLYDDLHESESFFNNQEQVNMFNSYENKIKIENKKAKKNQYVFVPEYYNHFVKEFEKDLVDHFEKLVSLEDFESINFIHNKLPLFKPNLSRISNYYFAISNMNSGKFEEALDLFLEILEEKSSEDLSKELLMNIAFCLKELGDQENYEIFIEKANGL